MCVCVGERKVVLLLMKAWTVNHSDTLSTQQRPHYSSVYNGFSTRTVLYDKSLKVQNTFLFQILLILRSALSRPSFHTDNQQNKLNMQQLKQLRKEPNRDKRTLNQWNRWQIIITPQPSFFLICLRKSSEDVALILQWKLDTQSGRLVRICLRHKVFIRKKFRPADGARWARVQTETKADQQQMFT